MNFKPLADRILVSRLEAEKVTTGGLIIPDASAGKANKGRVMAIGPGRPTKDGGVIPVADIQLGDIVMFEGLGTNIKVDGVEYVVLKEQEIMAIVGE